MTTDEAIQSLQNAFKKAKETTGTALDKLLGVAMEDRAELQKMIDDLLKQKGNLSTEQETQLSALLEKQKQERKVRNRIRVKNAVLAASALLGTGVVIYLSFKSKKK